MPQPTRRTVTPASVTIGLPVYNAVPFLGACLRSIFAQSLTDWELLAVDDGSRDGSLELLREVDDPRVQVFADGRHLGLGARLNEIVRRARAPYVARMDADDLMHPERLREQLRFLRRNPTVDVVGCSMVILDSDLVPRGLRAVPAEHTEICDRPLEGFRIAHATMVGNRDWFAIHPYDETAPGCEDWQLLLGAYRHSRFANLAEALYFYREYDSYSLAKYIAAKRKTIGLLWHARQGNFPWHRVVMAVGGQFARIAAYLLAAPFGLDRKLLDRRSLPLGMLAEPARQVIAEVLQEPLPQRCTHADRRVHF